MLRLAVLPSKLDWESHSVSSFLMNPRPPSESLHGYITTEKMPTDGNKKCICKVH